MDDVTWETVYKVFSVDLEGRLRPLTHGLVTRGKGKWENNRFMKPYDKHLVNIPIMGSKFYCFEKREYAKPLLDLLRNSSNVEVELWECETTSTDNEVKRSRKVTEPSMMDFWKGYPVVTHTKGIPDGTVLCDDLLLIRKLA